MLFTDKGDPTFEGKRSTRSSIRLNSLIFSKSLISVLTNSSNLLFFHRFKKFLEPDKKGSGKPLRSIKAVKSLN